jgi:biopolymer transport protein ExbB
MPDKVTPNFSGVARLFAIIQAAGWPIWFLIVASVIAVAIIGERLWSLRESVVMPRNLLARVVQEYRQNGVTPQMLARLSSGSPLGQIFAAGLRNARSPTPVIKEAIEESGRSVAIELERFLTSLGTIAAISPLLGLFGTVVGMIEIFGAQTPSGTNPLVLAHGISIALYNTAYGLVVAVPAMIFYRHFRAKVDEMLVDMEMQGIKLVEILHGERQG